jgi:peptidoglycan/LPS O-acetylase OafA/YrhL
MSLRLAASSQRGQEAQRASGDFQPLACFMLACSDCGIIGLAVSLYGFDYQAASMRVLAPSLASVAFGSLIILSLTSARIGGGLSNSVLRSFGKYSYAIYLIYYPVWILVAPHLLPVAAQLPLSPRLLAWLVLPVLSLALGWLSWQFIKRFFPFGHQVSAA